MVLEGLDYFKQMNTELSLLDRTIISQVVFDEEKIMRIVEEGIQRSLAGRTTESIGI